MLGAKDYSISADILTHSANFTLSDLCGSLLYTVAQERVFTGMTILKIVILQSDTVARMRDTNTSGIELMEFLRMGR